MPGAAFDAAAAVHAVGILKQAVFCIAWREEAERTRFGAEAAFHACIGNADAAFHRPHRLVDFSHRADGTPEIAVEDHPSNESNRGRDGNHDIQQHSPGAERCRAKPEDEPREHHRHNRDGRLSCQKAGGHFASRVGQQRIERAARAEVAAAVPSAMPQRADEPHGHVKHKAIREIWITPAQRQHCHEQ